ncbi:linolenate hydroperoxide lyase, chloroplastic-like [Jatropha curcas]|uniref:linolenate hydroperoxide lyase, chloroplastic-like n=1 Tax=Jatropha curcas TaxID=180498 RepID=UPI001895BE23|nr:linolenate hydroperoxide lyase, chloroplastic-like [Jatropha curcas]
MATVMTKMMNVPPGTSPSFPSSSSSFSPPQTISTQSSPSPSLPLRKIPGSYGWPLLGPISDRLDYSWFQGPETFFKKRIEKYKSTVFRTNVPPTFPFFTDVNPNVVAVLDCKSFSHLFDMEVVEKKNVLVGDFMPSLKFTGNIRTSVYLDPSEPEHGKSSTGTPWILDSGASDHISDIQPSDSSPILISSPAPVMPNTEADNAPIALRKGIRSTCNSHPIYNFLSYHRLSPSYYAFISALFTVSIPKSVSEALNHPGWSALL